MKIYDLVGDRFHKNMGDRFHKINIHDFFNLFFFNKNDVTIKKELIPEFTKYLETLERYYAGNLLSSQCRSASVGLYSDVASSVASKYMKTEWLKELEKDYSRGLKLIHNVKRQLYSYKKDPLHSNFDFVIRSPIIRSQSPEKNILLRPPLVFKGRYEANTDLITEPYKLKF